MDLHVGYSSWGIDRLFHIILNAYSCAMPNVHLRLHDRRVEDNVDALLAGKLELAFIFAAPKPGALRGLRFLELSREHIVSPSRRRTHSRAGALFQSRTWRGNRSSFWCRRSFLTIISSFMWLSLRQRTSRRSWRNTTVSPASFPQLKVAGE